MEDFIVEHPVEFCLCGHRRDSHGTMAAICLRCSCDAFELPESDLGGKADD